MIETVRMDILENIVNYLNFQKNNSKSISDVAKEYGISRNTLIDFLIRRNYCYRSPIVKKIIAIDRYNIDKKDSTGIFCIEEYGENLLSGRKNIQTKITPFGVDYLRKKLKKEGII